MRRYTGPQPIKYICTTCNEPILDLTRYQHTNVFIPTLNAYCGKCGKLVALTSGLVMNPIKQKSHQKDYGKKKK
jgi:hypothetical protein